MENYMNYSFDTIMFLLSLGGLIPRLFFFILRFILEISKIYFKKQNDYRPVILNKDNELSNAN